MHRKSRLLVEYPQLRMMPWQASLLKVVSETPVLAPMRMVLMKLKLQLLQTLSLPIWAIIPIPKQ